jgi:hypothetical protein
VWQGSPIVSNIRFIIPSNSYQIFKLWQYNLFYDSYWSGKPINSTTLYMPAGQLPQIPYLANTVYYPTVNIVYYPNTDYTINYPT